MDAGSAYLVASILIELIDLNIGGWFVMLSLVLSACAIGKCVM